MVIIFWPLHVLIPTSIRISLSLSNSIFHSLSFPPRLSFHLISLFNSLVAFGVSCWAKEDGKCSEKKKVLFLFFLSFFLFFFYVLWPVLFTVINILWAQWRGCCVCVSVRKKSEFSLADGRGEQQEAFCQSTQPWQNHFSVSQTDTEDSIYMFLIFSESFQRHCAGGCYSY